MFRKNPFPTSSHCLFCAFSPNSLFSGFVSRWESPFFGVCEIQICLVLRNMAWRAAHYLASRFVRFWFGVDSRVGWETVPAGWFGQTSQQNYNISHPLLVSSFNRDMTRKETSDQCTLIYPISTCHPRFDPHQQHKGEKWWLPEFML
jgi:hypothetical protein